MLISYGHTIKGRSCNYDLGINFGQISQGWGRFMWGATAFSKDPLFMDHHKLGYPDGDGPGNERIRLASGDKMSRRWTPVIVIHKLDRIR